MVNMPRLLFRPRLLLYLVALLFAGAFSPLAHAKEDIVHFGNSVEVAKDETAQDVVCFFCSVHILGAVNGDTVVFFGNVDLDGSSNHDVVNFFGKVRAADNTSVGQNIVNFFGSVSLGENVSVGQDLVVMFGSLHTAKSASFGGDRVFFPAWIFWAPFILIFGGITFVVHEYRAYNRRRLLRGY
jgi:hypothetical protein